MNFIDQSGQNQFSREGWIFQIDLYLNYCNNWIVVSFLEHEISCSNRCVSELENRDLMVELIKIEIELSMQL